MARESRRRRDENRFGLSRNRMIDDILDDRSPWGMPAWFDRADLVQRDSLRAVMGDMREKIGRSRPIVADNVASYYFEVSPKESWDVRTDFPSCMPPFETFWVEYKKPPKIRLGSKWIPNPNPWDSVGILFESQSVDPDGGGIAAGIEVDEMVARSKRYLEDLGKVVDLGRIKVVLVSKDRDAYDRLPDAEKAYIRGLRVVADLESGRLDPRGIDASMPGISGVLTATTFIRTIEGLTFGPIMYMIYMYNNLGSIMRSPLVGIFGAEIPGAVERAGPIIESISCLAHVGLLTISFMNCKNVSLVNSEVHAGFDRARRNSGKRPFVRYHTIDIEPMKSVLRDEGNISENGLKKALHICRGYFATYTPEKPLFGKFPGTFWVPSHVRGSAKQGVVISDYNVNAPKNG